MTVSKHVAIFIASLIAFYGTQARAQETIATSVAGGDAPTMGDTATSTAVARPGSIDQTSTATTEVAHSTITSQSEPSTAAAGDLATVSITAAPGYQVGQNCIKSCLYYDQDNFGQDALLPIELGCDTSVPFPPLSKSRLIGHSTIYNACYCTSVVASKASSIISACINELCVGTAQVRLPPLPSSKPKSAKLTPPDRRRNLGLRRLLHWRWLPL
jgi:hypothetical protein